MSEIEWILGREYETRGVGVVRYAECVRHETDYEKYRVRQIEAPHTEYGVAENGRYMEDGEYARDVIRGPLAVAPPVEETCGNCRFWNAYRNHDGNNSACGNCRVMPSMVEKLDFEWCGQWEAKKQ